jgi:hypothetical protein
MILINRKKRRKNKIYRLLDLYNTRNHYSHVDLLLNNNQNKKNEYD